jgi:hypothetical protein
MCTGSTATAYIDTQRELAAQDAEFFPSCGRLCAGVPFFSSGFWVFPKVRIAL